jgi:hypothetical protein
MEILKIPEFVPVYIKKTSHHFIINIIVYRVMSRQVELKA